MSTTVADNHVEEEGDFRGETKYKQFSAAVERALKGFEVSTEWPDLISSLAKLNKVRDSMSGPQLYEYSSCVEMKNLLSTVCWDLFASFPGSLSVHEAKVL